MGIARPGVRLRSRRGAIGVAFSIALVLAGCSDDGGNTSTPSTATSVAESTTTTTTTSTTTAAPPTTAPPTTTTAAPPTTAATTSPPNTAPPATAAPARAFNFGAAPQVIASGLDVPWGLAFLPDGSALVAERDSGRILQIPPGGGAANEVSAIPDVRPAGEGGLLGLAVSPTYAQDGLVFAYYTAAQDNRVVRFQLGQSPQVLVSGIRKASIHDGGRIAFGPDGMLYVSTGDASAGNTAQDPATVNGKILRMRPDGSPPPDNPDPSSLVWTLGHRNVQGFAWDSTGRMFASEFGQNTWDEVNLIQPGGNYGWPIVEGPGTGGGRFVAPLVTWRTNEASPAGVAIAGQNLHVAALRGQRLWQIPITPDGLGDPVPLLQGQFGRLRTVVVAPDGSLWITTSNRDGRGSPRADDDKILRFAPTG